MHKNDYGNFTAKNTVKVVINRKLNYETFTKPFVHTPNNNNPKILHPFIISKFYTVK